MKLHLPKMLTAAIIAAFAVTGAYATTTTTTTYADGTVFNGDIWTWNNAGDGKNVSAADSKYTKYGTNPAEVHAGNEDVAGVGKFWQYIQDTSETAYVGNTLRFDGATNNIRLNTDFKSWVWIGGIITEEGNNGTYTLGRDSSDIRLKGNHDVNMIIKSDFTLKSGSERSTEIMTGGTWNVAAGKTLTFTGKSLTHYTGQTVKITGAGTVTFATPYTGQAGALFNVGEGATLSFANTAQLGGTITNAGTVTFAGTVSVADFTGFEGESNYSEGTNGYLLSAKYTLWKGEGTITGLDTIQYGGSTLNVVDKAVTFDTPDYTTYYVNSGTDRVSTALEDKHTPTAFRLAADTELIVDKDVAATVTGTDKASSLVSINSGITLTGTASKVTIDGDGTYALTAGTSALGTDVLLAEGDDWTGTVLLSGVSGDAGKDLNLNKYGHAGSKVELNGVTGFFLKAQEVFNPELVLDNDNLTINNGYSDIGGTTKPPSKYTFAGGVSGDGKMIFHKTTTGIVTQHLYFTGDVSEWHGGLTVKSGFNVYAQFSGEEKSVKAVLENNGGAFHVEVGTGEDSSEVTFYRSVLANDLAVLANSTAKFNDVVDIRDSITVGDNATVTFNDSVTAGAITVNGDASITFGELHLTQTITNEGTVNFTQNVVADDLEVQGGTAGYFDLNDEFSTDGNGYAGNQESYLAIVDGGTVNGTIIVTQDDVTYYLSDSGLAMGRDGNVDYGTYYLRSGELSATSLKNDTTEVIMSGGTLTADKALDSVTATNGKIVIEQDVSIGAITADNTEIQGKVAPESVTIVQESYVLFDNGIEDANGVQFSSQTGVTVLNYGDDASYSIDNPYMMIAAQKLTLESVKDQPEVVEIANTIQVSSIVNNSSSLLVVDSLFVEGLASVEATGGNIGLMEALLPVANMTIAEGKSVVMLDPQSPEQEGTITISDTLTAGGGTLLANLTLVGNSTLDVNGGDAYALTLGSLLTVDNSDGLVNLDGATLDAISGLNEGDRVTLVKGLNGTSFSTNLTHGEEAGLHFNLSSINGSDYMVFVTDSAMGIEKTSSVPEPTTGTLSLLALMALAARRRRH